MEIEKFRFLQGVIVIEFQSCGNSRRKSVVINELFLYFLTKFSSTLLQFKTFNINVIGFIFKDRGCLQIGFIRVFLLIRFPNFPSFRLIKIKNGSLNTLLYPTCLNSSNMPSRDVTCAVKISGNSDKG